LFPFFQILENSLFSVFFFFFPFFLGGQFCDVVATKVVIDHLEKEFQSNFGYKPHYESAKNGK
jgi:hypothetical protein